VGVCAGRGKLKNVLDGGGDSILRRKMSTATTFEALVRMKKPDVVLLCMDIIGELGMTKTQMTSMKRDELIET